MTSSPASPTIPERMLGAFCGGFRRAAAVAANLATVALAMIAAAQLPGCIDAGEFTCERDSQCEWKGEPGLCIDPGFCAVADPECESGYRFHDRGSSGVAGQCADVVSTTSTSTSTTVATTAETSTGVADASTTDAVTSGEGSTGADSCMGSDCACAASVATGLAHTCVARTDGVVVCWGDNRDGQLGMGETSAPTPYLRYPELGSDTFIVQLWAGNQHTCGLSDDGRLICWGNNESGETLPFIEAPSPMFPIHIEFVQGLAALTMAPAHTCAAVVGSQQTWCWGANGYGELGVVGPIPGPYMGAELGVGPIEQMASGRDHTCVALDGVVKCWGRNQLGQLGNPAVPTSTVDPQTVLLDRPPTLMAAGRDHTCAVVNDGTVRCWGGNAAGQIGNGTIVDALTPVTPAGPPGTVVALTGRLDSLCALTDIGDVYCWGDANGDTLGMEVEDGEPVLTPTRVFVTDELPEPIVEVDLGRYHICARVESGGLWCWGSTADGQIGPMFPPDQKRAVAVDLDCPT